MIISVEDRFKQKYDDLWTGAAKNYSHCELVSNGYDVVDHIYENSMMIVGLNPSIGQNDKPQKVFEKLNPNSYPRYYHPIFDFAHECGFEMNFSYADIFAMRCSSQKHILNAIKQNKQFEDFCIEQFCLFKEILLLAKTSVIVVANSYARKWFKKGEDCLNDKHAFAMEMDDEIGTYRIKEDSALNNVPVFFSGMLSGQHSLDLGSRERLVWHIKRILEPL